MTTAVHTFLTIGQVTAAVKIFDNGTLAATTTDTITVTAATANLSGTVLQPVTESNTASILATTALATFTDGETTGSLINDYTASINWGDGTTGHPDITAGTIAFSNGAYKPSPAATHGYNNSWQRFHYCYSFS